ncbi:hypothetical protein GGR50DRAFT_507477 [Xylaria sp. CBS 124048]|nr:hypothetical protein GGR50DRAFT_507477 [Xylaria sp. CBS 124048]
MVHRYQMSIWKHFPRKRKANKLKKKKQKLQSAAKTPPFYFRQRRALRERVRSLGDLAPIFTADGGPSPRLAAWRRRRAALSVSVTYYTYITYHPRTTRDQLVSGKRLNRAVCFLQLASFARFNIRRRPADGGRDLLVLVLFCLFTYNLGSFGH